jgi:hypothetical protein
MIREANLLGDTQSVFYTLLTKLQTSTAPWTSWLIIKGWPEARHFAEKTSSLIYVMLPKVTGYIKQQGGLSRAKADLIIGSWTMVKSGGSGEAGIVSSSLLALFRNPQTLQGVTFTLKIGSTTYTNKKLHDFGVKVKSIVGPSELPGNDELEIRHEMTLNLEIGGS